MEKKCEDKLVVFGEYANEAEASIVKGVLETNGIPCMVVFVAALGSVTSRIGKDNGI